VTDRYLIAIGIVVGVATLYTVVTLDDSGLSVKDIEVLAAFFAGVGFTKLMNKGGGK